ncbi:hypothetical protein PNEG_00338 [Pneumocystis murina B123]|uniref:Uncharacterized protein n=1 Tax=Pneumocystis murina (strain B123) TaxID=1069680 RepID=M7PLJ1_PNEMU|nr:hypothetical protein PNEG_00338 [Pneumocystis murina B123]EMR11309.1 hypothetical protein PNEG_00338 [Pneumocystis murina B123]
MKEMQKVSSNFEKLRKQGHKKKDTEIKPFIENQWHKNMDLNIQPLKLPSNKDSTFKKVGFKKAFHHFNNNLTDSMDSKKTFQSPDSYDSNITKLSSNPLDLIDDEKDLGELYNPHVPTSP